LHAKSPQSHRHFSVSFSIAGEGNLNGRGPSPSGIKAEHMTNEVWDYVFLGKPLPQASQIPLDTLHKLRNAFLYVFAALN
jgi:leucyl-tRNA synthetase